MQSGPRAEMVRHVADAITSVTVRHPVRVAVDGRPASGKSTLADELGDALCAQGRPVIRATVDEFMHPRTVRYRRGVDSPEGCYHDSFDFDALHEALLHPLPAGSRQFRERSYDRDTDCRFPEIQVLVVGRNHRYSAAALDDFLERQRVQPGTLRHLAAPPTGKPEPGSHERRAAWQVARQEAARNARARRDADKRAKLELAELQRLDAERIAAARSTETEERRAAVVARYAAGDGAERIARDLHIGVRTVYNDLQRSGVPRRGRRSKDGVISYADVSRRST